MKYIKSMLLIFFLLYCSSISADVTDYFNKISKDSNLLYTFFKNMPKGGELHYHLSGGPYPETLLKLAAGAHYCLDKKLFAASKGTCNGIPSQELFKYPLFYLDLIKHWSFKDFVPGTQSGHDHFFETFDKFLPIETDFRPELLANVIQRASTQNEQYLEVMVLPDNAKSLNFADLIKDSKSHSEKRRRLLAHQGFQSNINQAVLESDRILKEAYKRLGCEEHASSACKIRVKLLYYVLREQGIDQVFAQALSAFEAVSRSNNLVGVNLVQAEDGPIARRDYREQMAIFRYLHFLYPRVNISLHAGELTESLVDAKDLKFHIHDAIFTAHAQRIGHGLDIKQEDQAKTTIAYMAKHQIPVEVNLVSNLKILNIAGPSHPLRYYLAQGVPLVLSTDDEGILRTDLSQQYVAAVIANGLTYQDLKQMNRNTLTYAFLPGKSLWLHAAKAVRVPECQHLDAPRCKAFIKISEKASLQWALEKKLEAFEKQF